MSVTQQRTDLYNAVNAVSNIGVGHNRYRYHNEWNVFLGLFKTTIATVAQIRGFMLEYRGVTPNELIEFTNEHRTSVWWVHMFLGLSDDDSTEVTFAALVEAVITAVKDNSTLQNQNTYYYVAPAITPVYEARLFGDVLCHYTQVQVLITEFVT